MSIASLLATYERAITHEVDAVAGVRLRLRELGPADALAQEGLFSAFLALAEGRGRPLSAAAIGHDEVALMQRAVAASLVAASEPPAEGAERVWEPVRGVLGASGGPDEFPVAILTAEDLLRAWAVATGAGRRAAERVARFPDPRGGVGPGGGDADGARPPGPLPPVAASVDG